MAEVADGDDRIAHAQRVRIAELGGGERFIRLDLENGEVARLVAADERGGIRCLVPRHGGDLLRLRDDVAVRDEIAVLRHHDARARARVRDDGHDAGDHFFVNFLQAQRVLVIGRGGRRARAPRLERQLRGGVQRIPGDGLRSWRGGRVLRRFRLGRLRVL